MRPPTAPSTSSSAPTPPPGSSACSQKTTRTRRGPRRHRRAKLQLHTDKGYDCDQLRRRLRKRGIRRPIARAGTRPPPDRARHRWVVERTVSWSAGCRRLHRHHERKAEYFLGLVGIAAAVIGHRRFASHLKHHQVAASHGDIPCGHVGVHTAAPRVDRRGTRRLWHILG
ncbi:transposase [Streptomyces lydicus]|uniref:transposase n=1 Tax=Streptomyces lydicus TaxID=47763 RepID=UPI003685B0F4